MANLWPEESANGVHFPVKSPKKADTKKADTKESPAPKKADTKESPVKKTDVKESPPKGAAAQQPSLKNMSKDALIEMFCQNVRILTNNVCKKYPNDMKMVRIRDRIMLGASEMKMEMMTIIGDYLKKPEYAQKIFEEDIGFFLDNDYTEDVATGVIQERIDLVNELLPRIRELCKSMPKKEQMSYMGRVRQMLETYMAYLELTLK
jgi:hypothetical protein